MEISNLLNEEFKVMVIKILNWGRRMDEHRKYFNKEMENIIKYQVEDTELKNTPNEFNNRLDKAEEKISLKARQWNSPN